VPDNAVKIVKIRTILESGVSSVTVPGVTTVIDRESLRKELRRLEGEDDTLRSRRPPIASINMSNLF